MQSLQESKSIIIRQTSRKQERSTKNSIVSKKISAIKVSISKALIALYIKHNEFALVNNELGEYNEMKEEIKNRENDVEYTI